MRERMKNIRAQEAGMDQPVQELKLNTNKLLLSVTEKGQQYFQILGSPFRLAQGEDGSWTVQKEQLQVDQGKTGDPAKEHFLVQVQKTFLKAFGVVPLARFTLFETPFYFQQTGKGMWDVISGQARRGSTNVMVSWLNWENLRGFTLKAKLPFQLSVDPKDIDISPKPKGRVEFRKIVDKGKHKVEIGFEPLNFEAGIKAGRADVWKEAIDEFRRILRYIAVTCSEAPSEGEDDDD
jgi:hypothetical protein